MTGRFIKLTRTQGTSVGHLVLFPEMVVNTHGNASVSPGDAASKAVCSVPVPGATLLTVPNRCAPCGAASRGSVSAVVPSVSDATPSARSRRSMQTNLWRTCKEALTRAMRLARPMGCGVATGLVSVPNRYMHSAVETVSLDDVDRTADLLAAFVRGIDETISWVP